MSQAFIQVTTTCDDREVLKEIANHLIANKLAACCQLAGPVESTYCWKDVIETTTEYRLFIKTRRCLFDPIAAAVSNLHPYENPQLTAVAIVEISHEYAQWLVTNTRSR